jgi:hypothetical protein
MPQIRVTSRSGSIPTVSQLSLGDIAVNIYDGRAFLKKQVGATQTIVEIGGGYGNWVYLNRAKDFDTWVTIDLPHVSELQKWYLSETGVNMDRWKAVWAYDYAEVESLNVGLVIGAHSLSELSFNVIGIFGFIFFNIKTINAIFGGTFLS